MSDSFGAISIKTNLRRSAVSMREIDLSAEFIVPMTYRLFGTENRSPKGSVTDNWLSSPHGYSKKA